MLGSPGTPAAPADPGFDGLVAEGLALLPAQSPEWTNHNASDPGITLLEMLAYYSDALLYRLGRVSQATQFEFLQLLTGHAGSPGVAQGQALRAATEQALADLAQIDCAVTPRDHELIALKALSGMPCADGTRVRCLPQTDIESRRQHGQAVGAHAGHVSVIVLVPRDCPAKQEAALLARVREALEPRRLLTSRLHVVAPHTIFFSLRLWVSADPGADRHRLAARLVQSVEAWCPEDSALADGSLALSEIADLACGLPGVEGVDKIVLSAASWQRHTLDGAAIGLQLGIHATIGHDSRLGGEAPFYGDRLIRDQMGVLAAVALRPWELPRLVLRPEDLHWTDAERPASAWQGWA